jgi:tannase/feruloyl esterase
MNMLRMAAGFAATILATIHLNAPAHAASCEALTGHQFPDGLVTSAVPVPGPSFTAPNGQTYQGLPPFCRVTATSTPTPDSLINIEVWLPISGWNQRFIGNGNGGYAGTIAVSVPSMIEGLQLGFAVASTDMGTAPSSNNDGDALVGHPEKWVDFGWRATHLMTAVSKEIIQAFYGAHPRYTYFNGCSTGGQQALMEAQRFPTDYNGILGGDPANNRTHVHTSVVWVHRAMNLTPNSYYTSDKVNLVTSSVLAACVVRSGGVAGDQFLTDPRRCTWQPSEIQCSSATATNCLNPDQVNAANLIYGGTINPANGHVIFPGSVKGSENATLFGWNDLESPPEPQFDSLFKWVFGLAWQWQSFDYDSNMSEVDQVLAADLNANNTDLSTFEKSGGKLLMYQGWADPLVAPQDPIDYYLRVAARFGQMNTPGQQTATFAKLQKFYRLFMVPGMNHCAGGPGPNAFGNLVSGAVVAPPPPVNDAQHNALIALQHWVENGVAPDQLIATKYNQDQPSLGITMQRPLCPYPQTAHYKGSGDTNDARSFGCVADFSANNPMASPEYLN